MGAKTSIEWTTSDDGAPGSTWNPIRGCTRVSDGCRNCYAEIMAARFSQPGRWGHGFAEMRQGDHRWTGKVALVSELLGLPLRWRKPRRIFVNSTSDLFHEGLPDETIDRVFATMALAPWHTNPTTPRGKVPLSVKDQSAQDLLWTYAQRRRAVDAEFSDDLEAALRSAGYRPRRVTAVEWGLLASLATVCVLSLIRALGEGIADLVIVVLLFYIAWRVS